MKTTTLSKALALSLTVLMILPFDGFAQKKKKKGKSAPSAAAKPKDAIKKIADVTKTCKKMDGLFPVYQDTTDGSIKMVISGDQLEKEFIYFSQIADGVVEARAFRGSYRGSKVFTIKKYFNKIEFVSLNTSYYFDPENKISKSSSANISEGLMASLKIEAMEPITCTSSTPTICF